MQNHHVSTPTLLVWLGFLIVMGGVLLTYIALSSGTHAMIATYDDCARAGYPIMESYPSRCTTPEGRTFTNPREQVTMSPTTNPDQSNTTAPVAAGGCKVGGCSAQLCGEAGEDLMSTCEYNPAYACYKAHSTCERQASGSCGWTPNAALSQCLSNPPTVDTSVQIAQ